jgi:hypothetical protein
LLVPRRSIVRQTTVHVSLGQARSDPRVTRADLEAGLEKLDGLVVPPLLEEPFGVVAVGLGVILAVLECVSEVSLGLHRHAH